MFLTLNRFSLELIFDFDGSEDIKRELAYLRARKTNVYGKYESGSFVVAL